jgi:hypothetical protein
VEARGGGALDVGGLGLGDGAVFHIKSGGAAKGVKISSNPYVAAPISTPTQGFLFQKSGFFYLRFLFQKSGFFYLIQPHPGAPGNAVPLV